MTPHEIVTAPGLAAPVGFAHAVVAALAAAGAIPDHLVSLIIYTTAVSEYRQSLRELGPLWRKHFGRHYPAVALLGVAELFDEAARIELLGTAVIPT